MKVLCKRLPSSVQSIKTLSFPKQTYPFWGSVRNDTPSFSRLWPKAVIFMPLSTKSGLIKTRGSRAVLSQGGFQLLDFRRLFGAPCLLRGDLGRPGRGLELTMLVAQKPVRRLVAPIVSLALTSRRALLPPARGQVPLGPFFANCHTSYGSCSHAGCARRSEMGAYLADEFCRPIQAIQ